MYIKRFLFAVILIASFTIISNAVDVSAKSAVLISDSGELLFEKNARSEMLIASTTKIVTAILAIENCDINQTVTIKPEYTGIEGSSIYLQPGEEISMTALIHGLLLSSGNDAAVAIAIETAGSIENFTKKMNYLCELLELKNTHFQNPNGLDEDGHYSSAYDLAKLMEYCMQNPVFKSIVCKKSYVENKHFMTNHNKLLYLNKFVDGGKTGFTKKAGRTLVSTAIKNGRRLYCVTLNAPNDWNDHKNLYDYGFALFKETVLIEDSELSIPVISGTESAVKIFLGKYSAFITETEKITQITELPHFVYAPVVNKVCGKITFKANDFALGMVELNYSNSIPLKEITKKPNFWSRLKMIFGG